MKYRKRPIVIEATQWFKSGDHPEDDRDTFQVPGGQPFLGEGKVVRYYRTPDLDGQMLCEGSNGGCGNIMHDHGWIDTLQGGHIVCPGDWIITDNRVADDHHGHHYPCKPAIFDITYDLVE